MSINGIYSIVGIEWNEIKQLSNFEQLMKLDGTHEMKNIKFYYTEEQQNLIVKSTQIRHKTGICYMASKTGPKLGF